VAVDPDSYSWLSSSSVEVAGCVTVVVGAAPDVVEAAFGAEAPTGDDTEPGDGGAWARFVHRDGVSIVVEDNGFEGTREEVLRPATQGRAKAASVFWNVNGLTQFTCARHGKQVVAIDLEDPDESELDEVPRPLRRLAAIWSHDDGDQDDPGPEPAAVGAAMVQTFTGAAFGPDVLEVGELRRLIPRASDLEQVGEWTLDGEPALRTGIEALDPRDQRAFARWVARAAFAEAGVGHEPQLLELLARLDDPEATPTPSPALDALAARQARADAVRYDAAFEGEDLRHDLEAGYLAQRGNATHLARHLAHPDALASALICTRSACSIYALSLLERRDIFREDETGRRRVGSEPNPRREDFVDLLVRLT
jgi:hypothetical protein